jgi:hypothetical protein
VLGKGEGWREFYSLEFPIGYNNHKKLYVL